MFIDERKTDEKRVWCLAGEWPLWGVCSGKYTHGFAVLRCVVLLVSDQSRCIVTHILQGWFTGSGAIAWANEVVLKNMDNIGHHWGWWMNIICTLMNELQWNANQNANIFFSKKKILKCLRSFDHFLAGQQVCETFTCRWYMYYMNRDTACCMSGATWI